MDVNRRELLLGTASAVALAAVADLGTASPAFAQQRH